MGYGAAEGLYPAYRGASRLGAAASTASSLGRVYEVAAIFATVVALLRLTWPASPFWQWAGFGETSHVGMSLL